MTNPSIIIPESGITRGSCPGDGVYSRRVSLKMASGWGKASNGAGQKHRLCAQRTVFQCGVKVSNSICESNSGRIDISNEHIHHL